MYSTHTATPGHLRRLAELAPGCRVALVGSEPEAAMEIAGADIVLGHRYLRQSLPHATRLRWVQSTAGGADRMPLDQLSAMDVRLTRCSIASPIIARHAVTLAWAMARALPQVLDQQRQGNWSANLRLPPLPRTAMVLGLGSIGKEIARLLARDGIDVIGVKQSAQNQHAGDCSRVVGPDAWRPLLPSIDWLMMALPATSQTRGMVDEAALRQLPPHAMVVNVGRGETLDTAALCRALRAGQLHGAALDVFDPKPQGPDDPLWQTPRLLISPHMASHQFERPALIEAFCEQQVARFLRNEPLLDEVDLSALAV